MPVLRVLVAEDYESSRESTIEVIRGALSAASVIEAATGAAALEALLQSVPEIAVLDFNMPLINGADVIIHYRKQRPEARTCFLLYSCVHTNSEHADRIGVPFLSKPFDINDLRAYMRRFVEQILQHAE